MEISREEYLALTRRIEELEEIVSSDTRKTLAGYVKETPYTVLSPAKHRDAIPRYNYEGRLSEAWECFLKLSRILHAEYETPMQRSDGYWPAATARKIPRTFANLTPEQREMSGEMISKMVSIYNEYFKAAHKTIRVTRFCDRKTLEIVPKELWE